MSNDFAILYYRMLHYRQLADGITTTATASLLATECGEGPRDHPDIQTGPSCERRSDTYVEAKLA